MNEPMTWGRVKEAMLEVGIQDDEVIQLILSDDEDPNNIVKGYLRGIEVVEILHNTSVDPGDRVTFNNFGRNRPNDI